ncbi:hypothetical protein PLEOSDRAFT_1106556 [Pleurotus ostreatus PC15]|uniref:Zn(2)-C6 fungal-type domain-containing protein n=1 Tax=Pleurotus ostreatus (strain PC15) TaxID=1137138 RepID=A0A067NCQ3_PLEO1|nr:hypothetical protein PLEOSDRAFT_1106556 [Pleurotus ostreatus PC15]
MNDSFQQGLQLKGEIMDLEFTLDTDHRKRRRNRTTQSCLNCHTSKRKACVMSISYFASLTRSIQQCDRKRPCQRCIQLGLTGLCVYEIDDPALRDDPSVDENTRLRNRIAELESLVRELRGKPHPRWADSSFREGDPSEKWHSRASKSHAMTTKQGQSSSGTNNHGHSMRVGTSGVISSMLTPIKTESPAESMQAHLYRFSPSPGPQSVRYHTFQAGGRSPSSSSFEGDTRQSFSASSSGSTSMPYQPSPYIGHATGGESPYSDTRSCQDHHGNGGQSYPLIDSRTYAQGYASSSDPHCPCRTNPATGHAYISLSQQLQSTINSVRQYSNHPPDSRCLLYRRILELHNQLHGNDPTDAAGPSYDNLSNTPTDSEIMTPLSASSGHASFHTTGSSGSDGVSPQEWNTLAAAGYNPYFPMASGEHHANVYNHVIS